MKLLLSGGGSSEQVIALYEESGLFYDGDKLNVIGKPYVEFNNIERKVEYED